MKKYILLMFLPLFSCEKKWNCEIVTPGLENPYYYEFEGTKQEMKDFENTAIGDQTIECR